MNRDEEFDQEVRAHLEMLAERFVARGMDPEQAYYEARKQFGGVTQLKQEIRDRRRVWTQVEALAQDIRHAFRQLVKTKRFTASAALTLALGIGASTAVFAVFDTLILRPLPYHEPDRLMAFRGVDRRTHQPSLLSYPDYFDFRQQNQVFEHLVSYRDNGFTLSDSSSPAAIQVSGEFVSWDLFPLLGIQPAIGRGFREEEEKQGTHVAILSHALWQRQFAGDPSIAGKTIQLSGAFFTVVGVAPAGFQFPMDTPPVDVWVTHGSDPAAAMLDQRGARMLDAIGRLKPGVSVQQAQKLMTDSFVVPELDRLAGNSLRPLMVLMGAVTLLLLIACANVANLLLARNAERAREFALRTALGAARIAIVRQMFVEGLVLGTLGSVGGVLLAVGSLRAVPSFVRELLPRLAELSVDGRVLVFAIAVTMLTSVLFSLAPALQALGADPAHALKEGSRSIARGHDRFRSGLVIAQITLGLILLVGAELLLGSFFQMSQRDPGFRADHLVTFAVALPDSQYNGPQKSAFSDRLLEQVRAIPGVQAAAAGSPLPLQGHQMRIAFDIEGQPTTPSSRPRSDVAIVTTGYFSAMGIPLLKGRDFSARDQSTAPPVLVVNQAFAKKHFGGNVEDAIGKRIRPGTGTAGSAPMREIVGVVGDARQAALGAGEADPIYYFPFPQLPWNMGSVVVRTADGLSTQEVEGAARAVIAGLDRQAAMHQVRSGRDLTARAAAEMQFLSTLMGTFAAVALLLAGAGLYGVLSFSVAQRRSEIGVRVALGAGRADVIRMVLRQAMRLVAVGLVLGVAGAVAVGRLLQTVTVGIRPGDPLVFVGACAVLLAAAGIAAYLPAARAAAVDPMEALRSE